MTTSANVTYYGVYKDGKKVGEHSQHHYCKPRNWKEEMAAYMPPAAFTVIGRWPDENEADHFSDPMPLPEFLSGKYVTWPKQDKSLQDEGLQGEELQGDLIMSGLQDEEPQDGFIVTTVRGFHEGYYLEGPFDQGEALSQKGHGKDDVIVSTKKPRDRIAFQWNTTDGLWEEISHIDLSGGPATKDWVWLPEEPLATRPLGAVELLRMAGLCTSQVMPDSLSKFNSLMWAAFDLGRRYELNGVTGALDRQSTDPYNMLVSSFLENETRTQNATMNNPKQDQGAVPKGAGASPCSMQTIANQCLELCWAIEKIPAGPDQTRSSVLASALHTRLQFAADEPAGGGEGHGASPRTS